MIILSLLLLASCQSLDITEGEVNGTLTGYSKHGNALTDITYETMTASGFAYGDMITLTSGEYTATMPMGSNFSDVDKNELVMLAGQDGVVFAVAYGSFQELSGLEEGSELTITISEKEGYLEEYNLRNLIKNEDRASYDSDEAFANFRAIKEGYLYRSSSPILGDERARTADRLLGEAGIKTIINLSDTPEELREKAASSENYRRIYEEGNVIALGMSSDFLKDAGKLREALLFMISHEGPYLIHCEEGKDRAGFVSAFIEALGGWNIKIILQDYMKSFVNYYGVEPGTDRYEELSRTITDTFVAMNGRSFPWAALEPAMRIYAMDKLSMAESEIDAVKAIVQGESNAAR